MSLKEPEKGLYEDPRFPFAIFTINKKECIPPHGPGNHSLHWHEDLQFTLVTKGSLSMMVNSKNYNLKSGNAIFINSRLLHMTNHISDDGEYVSINFPTKMISILTGSKLESDFVQPFTMNYNLPAILLTNDDEWQKNIISMLTDLCNFCKDEEVYAKDYEIAVRLQSIWLYFIRNVKNYSCNSSKSFVRKQEYIQLMLSYIHDNFMANISLSDISNSAHISQAECSRLFRKVLDISPYEYLLKYRIEQSIEMLKETNKSITEIAISVGFNDCSHFIQVFKKHTGFTPRGYIKNNLK